MGNEKKYSEYHMHIYNTPRREWSSYEVWKAYLYNQNTQNLYINKSWPPKFKHAPRTTEQKYLHMWIFMDHANR